MISRHLVELVRPWAAEVAGPHGYDLLSDLADLERVQSAPTAIVFYSARILEALTAEAVRRVIEQCDSNVFSNIETLRHFGLVSQTTVAAGHVLRMMGNAARHLHRRVREGDAPAATGIAEWYLRWFFLGFALRPRVEGADHDAAGSTIGRLLTAAEQVHIDLGEVWRTDRAAMLESAAAMGTLVDLAIARKAWDVVDDALPTALARFGDDLRLRQMEALALSRRATTEGDPARATEALTIAEKKLRALLETVPGEEETVGILAGVLKRQGNLEESHTLYLKGWEMTRRVNVYLGINAAATARWLRKKDGLAVARDVLAKLDARAATVQRAFERHGVDPTTELDLWEELTRAEATLLVDDLPTARTRYREAFRRYRDHKSGALDSALYQLRVHVERLGLEESAEDITLGG